MGGEGYRERERLIARSKTGVLDSEELEVLGYRHLVVLDLCARLCVISKHRRSWNQVDKVQLKLGINPPRPAAAIPAANEPARPGTKHSDLGSTPLLGGSRVGGASKINCQWHPTVGFCFPRCPDVAFQQGGLWSSLPNGGDEITT